MKLFVICSLIQLLYFFYSPAATAQAVTPPEAPPDIEVLAQRLANTMCQLVETEAKRLPLDKRSGMESRELLWRVLYLSMAEHVHSLAPFLTDEGVSDDVGGDIGEKATDLLQRQCPAGKELALIAGLYHLTQQQPTDLREQKIVRQMAAELCQYLSAANAEKPLLERSAFTRQALLQDGLKSAFKQHKAELEAYYGKKALRNDEEMTKLGTKISSFMAEDCPTILPLINEDAK